MRFGSLFAGIGGFDLGLELAGMQCAWQVEKDDYATRVLKKHWPNVRRWRDVCDFPPEPVDDWRVDLICGGFPCQDISNAGNKIGIEGERSGLWREYIRIIRVLRPRFVLVENVSALLVRGLGRVLGDLAESGYDTEWDCLPASAVGAPHIRDRIFILANASLVQRNGGDHYRGSVLQGTGPISKLGNSDSSKGEFAGRSNWWASEPGMGRVAYGVPARVDRLRGLGNAVVPQVAEWIGRRIMEAVNASA